MLELKLLSAAAMNRGCFNLVDKYIDSKELTPETSKILGILREYYERDAKASSVDWEIVQERVYQSIPEHLDKHKQIFQEFFKRIPKEVSVENLSEYIIETKRARINSELNQALLRKAPDKELQSLMEKWRELSADSLAEGDAGEEIYSGWKVEDLVKDHFDSKNLVKLLPVTLNNRVDGGAKPGHHLYVYAPTELGKTGFCVNLSYGFLVQKLRVLYIGNEDPIADINMRLINRITGKTKHEVKSAIGEGGNATAELQNSLNKANYSNFTIAGLAPGSFSKIKELTNDLDPHVVVLDQLGNLDSGVSDTQTIQLLTASRKARALAKEESRVVVSVGQAADNCYGKAILRKNDVQWSNVDLPGQLDLMIGMGATEEMEVMGTRRINLPKNKLSGNHDYFDVRFVKELSKVEELPSE